MQTEPEVSESGSYIKRLVLDAVKRGTVDLLSGETGVEVTVKLASADLQWELSDVDVNV